MLSTQCVVLDGSGSPVMQAQTNIVGVGLRGVFVDQKGVQEARAEKRLASDHADISPACAPFGERQLSVS